MGPHMNDPSTSRLKLAIQSSAREITNTNEKKEKDPISRTTEMLTTGFSFSKMNEDVSLLYRLAWSGTKVPHMLMLRCVDSANGSEETIEHISSLFSAAILGRFPPRTSYKRNILKQLITVFENNTDFVPDALYDSLGEVMSQGEGEFSYRIYLDSSGENVIAAIKEHNQQLCHGTTGLSVWQASCDLANLLCQYISVPENVLELGAGCGLSGLALSRVHSSTRVTLTDYDSRVLRQLQENVDGVLQGCSRVNVQNLDWCNFELIDLKERPALVVAADVVYDPDILPDLCSVISKCLNATDACEAIVASTLRDPATIRSFREQIDLNGMRIVEEFSYQSGIFTFTDESQHSAETLFPHSSTLDAPTIFFRIVV